MKLFLIIITIINLVTVRSSLLPKLNGSQVVGEHDAAAARSLPRATDFVLRCVLRTRAENALTALIPSRVIRASSTHGSTAAMNSTTWTSTPNTRMNENFSAEVSEIIRCAWLVHGEVAQSLQWVARGSGDGCEVVGGTEGAGYGVRYCCI